MLRYAKPLFWCAAIFAFVMAILPHPPRLPGDPQDKIQHLIAFATLGGLSALAFSETAKSHLIAALGVFGAAIEIVQAVPALHRDSSLADFGADVAAAAVAVWLTRVLVKGDEA